MKAAKFATLALFCATVATGAQAQQLQMTLAGASPGGLWSLIGVGVDRAVKASHPNSNITYQTTGGGFANVMLLDSGKAEMGLVHNAEARLAVLGKEPFKQPVPSIRAIANIYNWAPMQAVITKAFADKHGIKTFEDLAAKKPPVRLTVNRRGNVTEGVANSMMRAAGGNLDEIEKWGGKLVYAGSEEQGDLMRDGRVDALMNGVFAPTRFIAEVGNAVPVVMLPVSRAVIEKVAADEGLDPFVVPVGAYDFVQTEVPTVALGAMLIATDKMSDETAYLLAKALTENLGELTGVHKSLQALSPAFLASQTVIPYHPGAAKYYKEKGLLK